MRKLRIAVITIAGGVPAIAATLLAPACGSDDGEPIDNSWRKDTANLGDPPSFAPADASIPPQRPTDAACNGFVRDVDLPDAGDAATPEQLCAVQQPTAATTAARVTFTDYSVAQKTVAGFVALPADLEAAVVGTPTLEVVRAPGAQSINVTNMTKVAGGFQFTANFDDTPYCNYSLDVEATFTITCADGGTKTVASRTRLDLCDAVDGGLGWVSSGDQCCECVIIAEMAPSPIVSDKRKDDLPLARVVRLRVLELARAGRQVLLFAENDAGPDLEIEWNVSAGSIERIDADLVLWTLPGDTCPFGQVAVWNEAGAAVENFAWGTA